MGGMGFGRYRDRARENAVSSAGEKEEARAGDVYCGFRMGSAWKKPVVAEEGRGSGLNLLMISGIWFCDRTFEEKEEPTRTGLLFFSLIEEKKIPGESTERKGRSYQPRHGHMNKLKIGASYPAKWPSEWGMPCTGTMDYTIPGDGNHIRAAI